MTDQEMARALSGATRACRNHDKAKLPDGAVGQDEADSVCAYCRTSDGRQYVLDDRARKTCPYAGIPFIAGRGLTKQAITEYQTAHNRADCPCQGIGWLSTLLLPDGRWDVGLLIELLEEADFTVLYGLWLKWELWEGDGHTVGMDAVLAVAACKALGVEVSDVRS